MITFSWEGKTKQIEVKSGNLIPVSEIPEIYAPDGKAVVWYNGNNAFSFSNGINAELSLSSKVVDITAETVCDVIKTRYGDMEQLVKLQGNCSSELVIKMGAALKENPNAKIILDLGDVTGLIEIPQEAFGNNSSLVEITLPESVRKIGYSAFWACGSLKTVKMGENITSIPSWCFRSCSDLQSITIPESVTSIEDGAFMFCNKLSDIQIAGNNFVAVDGAIYTADRTTLVAYPTASGSVGIPETVKTIRAGAFAGSKIKSITLPTSVIEIGGEVFKECIALESIVIPEGVTNILDSTFGFCRSLKSITIPATVTSIAGWAFNGCEALETVNYAGTAELWSKISKGDNNECLSKATIIYGDITEVPDIPVTDIPVEASAAADTIASLSGRKLVKVTGDFDSDTISYIGDALKENYNAQILLDLSTVNGLTEIPQDCFRNSNSLVEITLPDSVKKIGSQAFSWCSSLQSVNNLGNITTIESWCFGVCGNLQSITIPASVTSIGQSAFSYCNNLRDIVIDEENENFTVKNRAIYTKDEATLVAYPSASETVEIPGGVTTIGAGAFAGSLIEGIKLPDSLTEIGNAAFHECTSLVSITIPESVTKISQEAFNCCSGLTSIVIPGNVTTIEHGVFHECSNLSSVTFDDPNGWYATDPNSGEKKQFELTDPSNNAGLLVGDYCYYYWTKEE